MNSEDELWRKIEALERENRALRDAAKTSPRRDVITVSEGSYQGHPTITFEAGGRSFTLGLRKSSIVLHCIEHIRRFVARHNGELKDWDIVRGSATGDSARPDTER